MSWFQNLQKQAQEALKVVQHDLQEFGIALKEDTEEVVTVVKTEAPRLQEKIEHQTLPEFQKRSALVAEDVQKSFSTVGSQFTAFTASVVTGTNEMISQVQEAVNMEMENKKQKKTRERKSRVPRDTTALGANGKYSRYESQVSAMQRDSSTYCDEPADKEDFQAWLQTFSFQEHQESVSAVLKDNAFMQELESRIVPLIVDQETFWQRYFYRLSKLIQKQDQREQLVKRATKPEEEELSWDVEEGEAPECALAKLEKTDLEGEQSGQSTSKSTSAHASGKESTSLVTSESSGVEEAHVPTKTEMGAETEVNLGVKVEVPVETESPVEGKTESPLIKVKKEQNIQQQVHSSSVVEESSSDDTVATGDFIVVRSHPISHVQETEPKNVKLPEQSIESAPLATPSMDKKAAPGIKPSDDIDEDWGEELDEDWGEDSK
mmetsp:Transcript_15600/g.21568  ORF Transcript_15600/g.21568 Transcript_15600/m.21568 type:complete len:435 (-) Transcript_15600:149-1453(-)|eukprot:CAMPEP_0196590186 /NCGR_PEP_ID=MMETSP1081-20130531/65871_1 /TAXON_ID=36882 /ORGANISM="Pyramimonas amylifera, Strain CCMP720" /LENGTH=434 /DNA_ID=CAMNT_0041913219 /DNA_START=135 /DNA_END=1439 /DNA_ORIENTATION=+